MSCEVLSHAVHFAVDLLWRHAQGGGETVLVRPAAGARGEPRRRIVEVRASQCQKEVVVSAGAEGDETSRVVEAELDVFFVGRHEEPEHRCVGRRPRDGRGGGARKREGKAKTAPGNVDRFTVVERLQATVRELDSPRSIPLTERRTFRSRRGGESDQAGSTREDLAVVEAECEGFWFAGVGEDP